MLLLAVYCAILATSTLPAGANLQTWVSTAPAWQGNVGEIDTRGRLVHQFGPHEAGKMTLRYDMATGRVSVRGSLQSYRYGHNSGPFSFAEAQATCQHLADALLVSPDTLRISSLETGVTVSTNAAPAAFLSQIARANYGPTQRPSDAKEPPANCAQPLQYTAIFEQYRVKIYDKFTYNRLLQKPLLAEITGNGFRFEIAYRKAKKPAAVLGWQGALTLANLMQPEVFAGLASALLKSWHHIHLPPTMDLQGLSIDERALLIAGSNPDFWQYAKQEAAPATYKRKRALFHRLQKIQAPPDTSATLIPHTADFEQQLAATLPTGYQL